MKHATCMNRPVTCCDSPVSGDYTQLPVSGIVGRPDITMSAAAGSSLSSVVVDSLDDVAKMIGPDINTSSLTQQQQQLNMSSISSWGLFEAEPGEFRLLQPVWDLRLGREPIFASPLFPIVISLAMYLVCIAPFTVIDLYGKRWAWIQRYKIQPDRPVGWPQVRRAMLLTFWNHALYILPVSVAQCVWTPPTELPSLAPGVWEFLWHQAVALLVFDAEYFAWHVVHHRVRWLYRHVHSVHHQYSATSTWVTEYLHPYELFSIGVFTTTSPWLVGAHPLTQWSFMQFSILISVDDHCGYDLPWLPHHWAPLWGGSVHHDMHHQRPLSNFEPFLNYLDRLFGSYCPGQRAGGYRPKALSDWEKKPQPVMEMAFGQADAERTTAATVG